MVLNTLTRLQQSGFDLVQTGVDYCAHIVATYPRRVVGVLAAILLGTGATAFAVAHLAPDAADIPVRLIFEAVQPQATPEPDKNDNADNTANAATAPYPELRLYRTDTTRSNDTAVSLLRRLGINDAAAAAFLRSDKAAHTALLSRAGRAVSAEADGQNRLQALQVRWTQDDTANFQRLVVQKTATGFSTSIQTVPLVSGARLAGAVIRSSLFAATDDARIPDAIAIQIAEIFSGDIDFHRSLRKGDRFSVVYETLQADGEALRTGRVLSAEFVNKGKTFQAAWFQEPGANKGQYYTLEGNSLRKAFLSSPLEFSRITSGFGMRLHPIAREWRAHKGVDYASPIGTKIRTVGDGVVEFAGTQRGYGNVVEVKHRDGKNTLYAHMNSIAVRVGQRVEQGDTLGTVGRTGWATGPHLHFEFRIKGQHQDPQTIAQENNTVPLSAAARPAFDRMVASLRPQLNAASTVTQASAQ